MAKLRANGLSISLDGYFAGRSPSEENPLGVGGEALHEWVFATRAWRASHGLDGGEEGTVDDGFAARGVDGVGATIMGRSMFGPVRGPWGDDPWKGWWEDDPPFRHPVFVLTHHARPPLALGETTFHFVTDGMEAALERAYDAAGGADVRVAGGADTVRQYLRAGLLDELHVAIVPVVLGGGVRLFEEGSADGYECVEYVGSPTVAHLRIARAPEGAGGTTS